MENLNNEFDSNNSKRLSWREIYHAYLRRLGELNQLTAANPLRNIYIKYINRIGELQGSNNIEELQKTLDHVINLLPSNVTSLSVPLFPKLDWEQPTVVTCKRESTLPEGQQKYWDMSDLMEFSMSIDSNTDYHPVDDEDYDSVD